MMLKLKLVKGNTTYEAASTANETVPAGYVKHGTKSLKYLVASRAGKGDRVAAADYYYDSV